MCEENTVALCSNRRGKMVAPIINTLHVSVSQAGSSAFDEYSASSVIQTPLARLTLHTVLINEFVQIRQYWIIDLLMA